jgi:hypothetical protein
MAAMSKPIPSVPRLVAAAATAMILALALSGCADLDALGSSALKHAGQIAHDLKNATKPAPDVVNKAELRGIAADISQFKSAPSLSKSNLAAEAKLKDFLVYEKSVSASSAMADQALTLMNANALTIAQASVVTPVTAKFQNALEEAAHDVLKATVCQTTQTLLSLPEAARVQSLGPELSYNTADALQTIPQDKLLDFIYQNYLRGFTYAGVQSVFSAANFAQTIYGQVEAIKNGITGIEQAKDPATTTGWIYYIRYCTI